MLTKDAEYLLIKRLEDLHKAANKRNHFTHTGFLDRAEGSVAMTYLAGHNIIYLMGGGYAEAERQMALIYPDNTLDTDLQTLPVSFIKLQPSDNRYNKKPTHRDYLGALMSLGIERRVLGDMILQDQVCILICEEHISDFILTNLHQVANSEVQTKILDNLTDIEIQRAYKSIRSTVASLRSDSIVKICTNTSRGSSMSLIKSGKVFINGRELHKSSRLVQEGDVLSIRGYGKYRVASIGSKTKKDRTVVEIEQYI